MFGNLQKRRARTLVAASQALAISAYMPVREKFPATSAILDGSGDSAKRWDFFYAMADIGTALLAGASGVPEEEIQKLQTKLTPELEKFHTLALKALGEVGGFCQDRAQQGVPDHANVGHWLFLNLKGQTLSDPELEAAVAIGASIATSMHGWYQTTG